MICGAISATLMFTSVKLLGGRIDSVQIVFVRALFGILIAAPVLMRRGRKPHPPGRTNTGNATSTPNNARTKTT